MTRIMAKVLQQALADAGTTAGTLNSTRVEELKAEHAYQWTISQKKYSVRPVGDPWQISKAMEEIYRSWFDSCLLNT